MADTTQHTEAEQRYITGFANVMKAEDVVNGALKEWREARDVLIDAGQGDNLELMHDLTEHAIAETGLGEDAEPVQRARRALEKASQYAEAVANGVDPRLADLILSFGGDPRKDADQFMGGPGGGEPDEFEF